MKKSTEDIELAQVIGRVVARRRIERGFSQEFVAEKLGMGYEAISRLERGTILPTVPKLIRIAEILDCAIEELIVETSHRPTDQGLLIANQIRELPEKDRVFIVNLIGELTAHLATRRE